jgi:non-lysosomal glucosylceramidase
VGDVPAAENYHKLFESGSKWTDANLFNGHYYIQKVRGIPKNQIAAATVGDMGADNTEKPEFQLGDGCLVDQLMGQYLADVAGLGPLVDPAHIRETLKSIWQFNYKRQLYDHDSVQRTYVLNDEAALVVCDYGTGKRPEVPFPYFAEAWTGLEYQAAATMIYAGMVREGVEAFENTRRRYDGERRNPWDEAECGHHYARAMSAWSGVLALSGFRYHGAEQSASIMPRVLVGKFSCFFSAAPAWGTFTHAAENGRRRVTLAVAEGKLPLRSVALGPGTATAAASATIGGRVIKLAPVPANRDVITFAEVIIIQAGVELVLVA